MEIWARLGDVAQTRNLEDIEVGVVLGHIGAPRSGVATPVSFQ